MPYVIAFVIIIVAAGALLLFRQPAEAPEVIAPATLEIDKSTGMPEGFTPPTEDPPMLDDMSDTEAATGIPVEAASDIELTAQPQVNAGQQTFVAEASYFTPRRTEHDMVVSITLEGETIVDTNITYDGGPAITPAHSGFDNAYYTEVIGQNINTVELSRVGGASLTSVAFNEAVAEIRAQL